MAGSRKTGTERYKPQPLDVDGLRDKVSLGRYRRGADDVTWTITLMLPNCKKVLSAGVCTEVQATLKAIQMYEHHRTLAEAGLDQPQPAARPAEPVFWDAAKIAVERLTMAYDATLKKEGRSKATKLNARRACINSVLAPAFELVRFPDLPAAARKWLPTYRLKNGEAPSQSRVGNLNHALQYVCDIAVEQSWLSDDPRDRPRLVKKSFKQPQQQPAFTQQDVLGMAWKFNDFWVWEERGRDRLYFRAWAGLLASSGLRAGLEVEMTLENQIEITKDGIFIYVGRNKGKYKNARTAVCRGPYFTLERILKELFEYRRMYWTAKADIDQCSIFADPATGKVPDKYFFRLFAEHIKPWMVDKNTGQRRVPYSFRHFYLTQCILDSIDLTFIAIVAGTSVQMIHKYYCHVTGKQAALKVSDISKVIGPAKLMAKDTPQLDAAEQDRLAALGVF